MKKIFNTLWQIFLLIYYKLAFYTGGLIDDEYYIEAGNAWSNLNNFKKAILNYKMALKTEDISITRNWIGWCYLNLGKYEEAYIHYSKAHEQNNDISHLIGMANCKYSLGNTIEAKSIINNIKMNNNNIDKNYLESIKYLENKMREDESNVNKSILTSALS
jgi:tetratricopeptide (TPR) repeat protein